MDKWWDRRSEIYFTGLVVLALTLAAFLVVPRYTNYSRSAVVGTVVTISGIFTFIRHGIAFFDFHSPNQTEEDNNQYNQIRRDLDAAENEVMNYDRVTRILDKRGVDPYSMLDSQTDSSHFLLLNFTNQTGPPLPSLEEDSEGDEDERFIRRAIEQDFEAQAVSSFTWVIPPWVVEEQSLNDATKGDLEEWVQENIYDRHEGDYEAFMPLIALIDLRRATSRVDQEGEFGTAANKIMSGSDGFTEEDYLKAIAAQDVNLLEVVKSGELVYFLPLDIDQDMLETFSDSDVQNHIMEFVDGSGLSALADEDNIAKLAAGIADVGIERSEKLSREIHNEAENWRQAISSIS